MISLIVAKAGIEGSCIYTNHSLRSTATTHLFSASLDIQLIMLRTGTAPAINFCNTLRFYNGSIVALLMLNSHWLL